METTEINKILIEALGTCYHDWGHDDEWFSKFDICIKCKKIGMEVTNDYIDFSSWDGFGILWEWANKQKWWVTFLGSDLLSSNPFIVRLDKIINPTKFAKAIAEYLYCNKETNER